MKNNYEIYTIYDKTGDRYSDMLTAENIAVAKRQFANYIRMTPFADDFELKFIGKYNRDEGTLIKDREGDLVICTGADVKEIIETINNFNTPNEKNA